jgi:hypothetical protein
MTQLPDESTLPRSYLPRPRAWPRARIRARHASSLDRLDTRVLVIDYNRTNRQILRNQIADDTAIRLSNGNDPGEIAFARQSLPHPIAHVTLCKYLGLESNGRPILKAARKRIPSSFRACYNVCHAYRRASY